jgi:diguanylate cyclase (GGDEF)-like protein
MGRAFRTGERLVIADVTSHRDFLPAVPGVMAEACLPLRAHGVVVGVLNVEAATQLSGPAVEEAERCAALLEHRLEELDVQDATPAQRLARAAARLATLEEPDAIVVETLGAARAVAGMESAMLALRDRSGHWAVLGATGPFAEHFEALTPAELARMSTWVDLGTSNYTMGEATGRGHAGHERLRRVGTGALMVLPLVAPERLGLLAVADRRTVVLPTEEVELLELLASHAASGLAMAEALERLRLRAASDPLTGLGHHGSFHAALPVARDTARGELAVLLVDLDDFKSFNDRLGHLAGDDVLRAVADLLKTAVGDAGDAYRLGGDEFAVLADSTGEPQALDLAERIRAAARDRAGVTLSIGVALALPDEPDSGLLARADAAAYAVKRSGRDGVEAAPRARTLARRA